MNIVIDNVDKSAYCTKYGCYETPRKVYGPNGFVAISGKEQPDLKTTKFDLTIGLNPMEASDLAFFTTIAQMETVTVTYFSDFRNQTVTATMIPSISSGPQALKNGTKTLVYPVVLTLREQ